MIVVDKQKVEEHLESSTKEAIEKVQDQYTVRKAPEKRNLEACLTAYTKNQLLELSEDNDFDAKKSWKKAKLVDYIEESILSSIEIQFIALGEENLTLLKQMVDEEVNVEELTADEADDYAAVYTEALSKGFLYTAEGDNQFILVMPDEIKKQLAMNLSHFNHLKREYQFRL